MAKRDYKVGYGRPPREHQFKKGESGNPSGRPRRAPSTEDTIERELARLITVVENGKRVQITMHEAIVRRAVHKAAEGNLGAIRLIESLRARSSTAEGPRKIRFTMKMEDD